MIRENMKMKKIKRSGISSTSQFFAGHVTMFVRITSILIYSTGQDYLYTNNLT